VDVLPNLFIPGAGKSGTTSLHAYLREHPAVYMSRMKELHFFSNDEAFLQGMDGYCQHFLDGSDKKYRGESSTTYMIMPSVAERIRANIPDPWFIFVLRNPIDRVWSHYRWLKELGSERRPLRQAFLADLNDTPDFNVHDPDYNFFFYGPESRYGTNLGRFYALFGADRILVITSEQLRNDPNGALHRCTEFLELAPMIAQEPIDENRTPPDRLQRVLSLITDTPSPSARVNRVNQMVRPIRSAILQNRSLAHANDRFAKRISKEGYSRLSPSDRRWLRDFFVDEVNMVRELTGQPLSEWERDFP
jgi:hypothetical protein